MTFRPQRTLEQQTNSLSSYMISGRIACAKNAVGSKLRQFFRGLSTEIGRVDDLINQIVQEHDINNTTDFIDEWESALGIPDDCFTQTTQLPIEQRRAQILAKIYMRRSFREDDYYVLRDLLAPGTPMIIEYLPGEFFTVRIHLPGSFCSAVFPLPFPLPFGGCNNIPLICAFNKVKAAYSRIIYIFDLP